MHKPHPWVPIFVARTAPPDVKKRREFHPVQLALGKAPEHVPAEMKEFAGTVTMHMAALDLGDMEYGGQFPYSVLLGKGGGGLGEGGKGGGSGGGSGGGDGGGGVGGVGGGDSQNCGLRRIKAPLWSPEHSFTTVMLRSPHVGVTTNGRVPLLVYELVGKLYVAMPASVVVYESKTEHGGGLHPRSHVSAWQYGL